VGINFGETFRAKPRALRKPAPVINVIAGCIYNMTIANIDNWRRFAQGSRFGAESLAEIYANQLIAKKVVFNLMDGLLGQYAGGPQPQPNYALHHATLYASRDPVALD